MAKNSATRSNISAELYSQQSGKLSELQISAYCFCYLESRPAERGRNALVINNFNGTSKDLLAAPASIRTRAQEYGGGSYLLTNQTIFYVLDEDQNIYAYDFEKNQHSQITSVNKPEHIQCRFADFCWDAERNQLICVCEDFRFSTHHPKSYLVSIENQVDAQPKLLIEGDDFYSNPRLSPDGNKLCYLSWNHPMMPWDSTHCFCAYLDQHGNIISKEKIAGGDNESIFQPQWSPRGDLYWVSDKNNWWNIYSKRNNQIEILVELLAEFATPQWVFGMSTYSFLNEREILCCFSQSGTWQLGVIQIESKSLTLVSNPTEKFQDISNISATNNTGIFLAGTSLSSSTIWRYEAANKIYSLKSNTKFLQPENISAAQLVQFSTANHQIAYAFYYPPTAKNKTLPPLVVICHGGPTGATETSLSVKIQFWTSRGFAVVDVNYRGSTGYGRDYRNQLKHQWGIADVGDVCFAAQHLIQQGLVDPQKIFIRGSSAGGFTVLAALAFSKKYFGRQIFCAGASLYGIGDLEALATDTHKFEAHYLDQLVGPYPQDKNSYSARSPIHHLENFNCPVIFFQGLKDKVVPPQQAEEMYKALKAKNIKTELVTFAEEGHGFRNAENIKTAIEKELEFYLSAMN